MYAHWMVLGSKGTDEGINSTIWNYIVQTKVNRSSLKSFMSWHTHWLNDLYNQCYKSLKCKTCIFYLAITYHKLIKYPAKTINCVYYNIVVKGVGFFFSYKIQDMKRSWRFLFFILVWHDEWKHIQRSILYNYRLCSRKNLPKSCFTGTTTVNISKITQFL